MHMPQTHTESVGTLVETKLLFWCLVPRGFSSDSPGEKEQAKLPGQGPDHPGTTLHPKEQSYALPAWGALSLPGSDSGPWSPVSP